MSTRKLIVIDKESKEPLIAIIVFWFATCIFVFRPFIGLNSVELYKNKVFLIITFFVCLIPILVTISFFKDKKIKRVMSELEMSNQYVNGQVIDCQFYALAHRGKTRVMQFDITFNINNNEISHISTDMSLVNEIQNAYKENRSFKSFKVYTDDSKYYAYRHDIIESIK